VAFDTTAELHRRARQESLPRESPEQNGTRLDFDSGAVTEIMLDPGSSAFVPE
jgi:hypothetical protein